MSCKFLKFGSAPLGEIDGEHIEGTQESCVIFSYFRQIISVSKNKIYTSFFFFLPPCILDKWDKSTLSQRATLFSPYRSVWLKPISQICNAAKHSQAIKQSHLKFQSYSVQYHTITLTALKCKSSQVNWLNWMDTLITVTFSPDFPQF